MTKAGNIYFEKHCLIDEEDVTVFCTTSTKDIEQDGRSYTSSKKRYDISLGTVVYTHANYSKLNHTLRNLAKDGDEVVFHLANFGGSCHSGFQLINAVKKCKAHVIMQVEFPSYSMGALLAISGDELIMEADTFLMFHNYSGGNYGKGQETIHAVLETDKWLKNAFIRVAYPFLSKKELGDLFKDQDVYIHQEDKDLETRIKRHFK